MENQANTEPASLLKIPEPCTSNLCECAKQQLMIANTQGQTQINQLRAALKLCMSERDAIKKQLIEAGASDEVEAILEMEDDWDKEKDWDSWRHFRCMPERDAIKKHLLDAGASDKVVQAILVRMEEDWDKEKDSDSRYNFRCMFGRDAIKKHLLHAGVPDEVQAILGLEEDLDKKEDWDEKEDWDKEILASKDNEIMIATVKTYYKDAQDAGAQGNFVESEEPMVAERNLDFENIKEDDANTEVACAKRMEEEKEQENNKFDNTPVLQKRRNRLVQFWRRLRGRTRDD